MDTHDVDVSGELNVTVDVSRWQARLEIRDAEGEVLTYLFSADAYLTENDHLWFGTLDEYDMAVRS